MHKKPAIVIVNDKMWSGYTYTLNEPAGANSIRKLQPEPHQAGSPEPCCARHAGSISSALTQVSPSRRLALLHWDCDNRRM
jgi:hypothetical protein